MALTEAGWYDRAAIELHASDASEAGLRKAETKTYGTRAFRQLPPTLKARYFEPAGETSWRVKNELYARIDSWSCVNAVRPEQLATRAAADVIFCRNLFIYFDAPTIQRVVDNFASHMPSPGFLCLGAAESLLRLPTRFELQDLGGAYVYVKP
jgi:chemotaxis protein methyltransferase CheR